MEKGLSFIDGACLMVCHSISDGDNGLTEEGVRLCQKVRAFYKELLNCFLKQFRLLQPSCIFTSPDVESFATGWEVFQTEILVYPSLKPGNSEGFEEFLSCCAGQIKVCVCHKEDILNVAGGEWRYESINPCEGVLFFVAGTQVVGATRISPS